MPLSKIPRVIFLDIEGVVVTHRSLIVALNNAKIAYPDNTSLQRYTGATDAGWHRFIDKDALGLVFFLAREMECQIVLTSTLRSQEHVHYGLLQAAPEFAKGPNGDEADQYLSFSVTERLRSREDEIRQFIADHGVEDYVVLDDRRLQIDNFVEVRPLEGFSVADCHDAKLLLSHSGKYSGEMPVLFL